MIHLVTAERELLLDCHRHRTYLAMCGAVLPVSDMEGSWCEPECERMITYCTECLDDAAKHNAEAVADASASEVGR